MKLCKLKDLKLELCEELEHLIDLDDKFEKATFVSLSSPHQELANLVTFRTNLKSHAVALSFCPFCGEKIRFDLANTKEQ
jgi:hypothetical protein